MIFFFVKPITYHGRKRVIIEPFDVKDSDDGERIMKKGWIPFESYYESQHVEAIL